MEGDTKCISYSCGIDITFRNYITYVQCAVISMHMKLHNGTFGAMNGLFLRSKNWCYRNGIAF